MSPELRDYFAAHLAAAFARDRDDLHGIARDAYDLADAMVAERARRERLRRAWTEDERPVIDEALAEWLRATDTHQGLLDEPAPLSERADDGPFADDEPYADEAAPDSWDDRELDPRWEVSDRWTPPSVRPGLASTRPGDRAGEDDKGNERTG